MLFSDPHRIEPVKNNLEFFQNKAVPDGFKIWSSFYQLQYTQPTLKHSPARHDSITPSAGFQKHINKILGSFYQSTQPTLKHSPSRHNSITHSAGFQKHINKILGSFYQSTQPTLFCLITKSLHNSITHSAGFFEENVRCWYITRLQ